MRLGMNMVRKLKIHDWIMIDFKQQNNRVLLSNVGSKASMEILHSQQSVGYILSLFAISNYQ